MEVLEYTPEHRDAWDAFVSSSKNGTFLFLRGYMQYHADRFTDASVLVRNGPKVIALLPASRQNEVITSHAGLTYGGFIVDETMTTPGMLDVLQAVARWLAERGVASVRYKTVPHIYHRSPAEEDRYALFRSDAKLVRRDVLSVVRGGSALKYQERRRRALRRAMQSGVVVLESARLEDFWKMLAATLEGRHGVKPVHTFEEIAKLIESFPRSIRLFVAERQGRIIGGTLVYESERVAHAQYIAADAEGRELGALDIVFDELLRRVFATKPYFDFGISNECDGRMLNLGLIEQKEGFGARAVVHDHYELALR